MGTNCTGADLGADKLKTVPLPALPPRRRRAVEISSRRNQSGERVGTVGAATLSAEGVQGGEGAGGRDLEDGAVGVRAGQTRGSLEVAVQRLRQRSMRLVPSVPGIKL